MTFGMSLRYTRDQFVFKFHKNRMSDDVIMTSSMFLQTIVNISNSMEPTNLVLGTNTQHHYFRLIIKMKVTLTANVGHRRRSKVTNNELMVISYKLH